MLQRCGKKGRRLDTGRLTDGTNRATSVKRPEKACAKLPRRGVGSMPKNRAQGVIFGILMSITMAYGMEVYNVAWKMGIPTMPGGFSNMTNDVFLCALFEAAYMWLFVFIFSNL